MALFCSVFPPFVILSETEGSLRRRGRRTLDFGHCLLRLDYAATT